MVADDEAGFGFVSGSRAAGRAEGVARDSKHGPGATERDLSPSPSIPERPDLSAHFECPSVLHPFLSLPVPSRSVAISVARDPNCSLIGHGIHGGARALHFESEGREFESLRARHKIKDLAKVILPFHHEATGWLPKAA